MLADDRPGNVNQALAVAEALGWPFTVKAIRYRTLARLPDLLLGASTLGLTAASRSGARAALAGAGDRRRPAHRTGGAVAEAP